MCGCGCELAIALALRQAADAAPAEQRPAAPIRKSERRELAALWNAMTEAVRWFTNGDTPLHRLDRGSGR